MRAFLLILLAGLLAAGEEPRLTVVTWNVMEDGGGGVEGRLPALLRLLGEQQADVYAFQEAGARFGQQLRAQEWAKGLVLTGQEGAGGLLIASRFPISGQRIVPFSSRQRRVGLVADIEVPGGTLAVATVHLDSFMEDGARRRAELEALGGVLGRRPEALLMGDCNFGDGEPEAAAVPAGLADLWPLLHPGDAGFTWNIEVNPLARAGSFKDEPSRRLDRVFLRSQRWRMGGINIIGDRPADEARPESFPSDHFGLRAVFAAAVRP